MKSWHSQQRVSEKFHKALHMICIHLQYFLLHIQIYVADTSYRGGLTSHLHIPINFPVYMSVFIGSWGPAANQIYLSSWLIDTSFFFQFHHVRASIFILSNHLALGNFLFHFDSQNLMCPRTVLWSWLSNYMHIILKYYLHLLCLYKIYVQFVFLQWLCVCKITI